MVASSVKGDRYFLFLNIYSEVIFNQSLSRFMGSTRYIFMYQGSIHLTLKNIKIFKKIKELFNNESGQIFRDSNNLKYGIVEKI